MRARGLVLPLLILVALCVVQVSTPLTGSNIPRVRRYASPSDWETPQLLPDPYLEASPTFMINGSSDEFSYSHESAENSVNLTWAHTAGTAMDFKNLPPSAPINDTDCNDFVYFIQSFDWPYEILPRGCNMTFEYAVYLRDAFNTEVGAGLYFRLQVFLIDSSGSWRSVFHSYPLYENTTTHRYVDLSWMDIIEVWGGMIEDESGDQDDPFDSATVAFCLAPARGFESLGIGPYQHPWMNVTGSVSAIIRTLKLDVIYESESETEEILRPLYNGSWTTPAGAHLEDLIVADEGSAYTVGRVTDYESQTLSLTVTKWSAQAAPLWARLWNGTNKAWGYGVAYHENHIYVVGEEYPTGHLADDIDVVLLKLDTDGNVFWSKTWDTDGVSRARDLAIASDGSIYVAGWFGYPEPYYSPTTPQLIKFDSNGDFQWNKTIGRYLEAPSDYYWDAIYQIEIDSDDHVSVRTMFNIIRLDTDGVPQWNCSIPWPDSCFALAPDGGYVCASNSPFEELLIEKTSPNGVSEWSRTYRHHLGGDWHDVIHADDIAVAPDGSIHAIVMAEKFYQSPFIVEYDTQGTYIEFHNLGHMEAGAACRIVASQNDLLHVASMLWGQILLIYGQAVGSDTVTILLIVGGGAIVAIVVVAAVKKPRWQVTRKGVHRQAQMRPSAGLWRLSVLAESDI